MNVVMILAGLLACLLLNTFPSASREQWYEDSTIGNRQSWLKAQFQKWLWNSTPTHD